MKTTVDFEAGTITFTADNGEVRIIEVNKFPAIIQRNFTVHGANQKYRDLGAGKTDEEHIELIDKLIEAQMDEHWSVTAKVGSELARALAEVKSITVAEATLVIDRLDKAKKAQVKKIPEIAAILARMAKEKAERKAEAARKAAEAATDEDALDLDDLL